MTTYYLVGRVPVKLEERADGAVALVAFNPLMGGFVADPRYYSAIRFEDAGPVREISETEYKMQVDQLREESAVLA